MLPFIVDFHPSSMLGDWYLIITYKVNGFRLLLFELDFWTYRRCCKLPTSRIRITLVIEFGTSKDVCTLSWPLGVWTKLRLSIHGDFGLLIWTWINSGLWASSGSFDRGHPSFKSIMHLLEEFEFLGRTCILGGEFGFFDPNMDFWESSGFCSKLLL